VAGQRRRRPKTPVTVLSGVLGAGKTTLLKRILEEHHGYRIAVIQNEFSTEMGIEAPLITDASGETFKDIYELPNGCLCCSAKDGLLNMLDRLLEERQRFDYVLVEATGTADPERICEIFWVDEGLGSRVYLDGVITLVDGRNVLSALDGAAAEGSGGDAEGLGLMAEAIKQVACADVLILNKIDLASEAQRKKTLARLAAINPTATLMESTYANVALSAILGIRAFERERLATALAGLGPPVPARSSRPPRATICKQHSFGKRGNCLACGEVEEKPRQALIGEHGVESLLLRGDSSSSLYDPEKVRLWLADVLWEDAAGGVYRCKGLFRGPPEDEDGTGGTTGPDVAPVAYALQGVGKLFEIEAAPRVSIEQSKFLFIGRGLRADRLESGLRGCLCQADEAMPEDTH